MRIPPLFLRMILNLATEFKSYYYHVFVSKLYIIVFFCIT